MGSPRLQRSRLQASMVAEGRLGDGPGWRIRVGQASSLTRSPAAWSRHAVEPVVVTAGSDGRVLYANAALRPPDRPGRRCGPGCLAGASRCPASIRWRLQTLTLGGGSRQSGGISAARGARSAARWGVVTTAHDVTDHVRARRSAECAVAGRSVDAEGGITGAVLAWRRSRTARGARAGADGGRAPATRAAGGRAGHLGDRLPSGTPHVGTGTYGRDVRRMDAAVLLAPRSAR